MYTFARNERCRQLLQTLCEQTVVMGWKASSWQHTHMKICSIFRRKFGPSLRCPMASSQSFLLAVSSRINCCCCSDSWKVSSIFTFLEGGSDAGDNSGKDTDIRLKNAAALGEKIDDDENDVNSSARWCKRRHWWISNIYEPS